MIDILMLSGYENVEEPDKTNAAKRVNLINHSRSGW
jgi:hypothetical protein